MSGKRMKIEKAGTRTGDVAMKNRDGNRWCDVGSMA